MAGPNGSGKSSILKEISNHYRTGPFINADEIEQALMLEGLIDLLTRYELSTDAVAFRSFMKGNGQSWVAKAEEEGNKVSLSFSKGVLKVGRNPSPYDAALAADFIRHELLGQGYTFTFETVLSHISKVDFLKDVKESGYKNYLYFICTTDPGINIQRIAQRVKLGGHDVPREKVIKRYKGSLEILSEIIPLCHRVFLFDNSSDIRTVSPVAEIDKGNLIIRNPEIPWWVDNYVIKGLYT
jgi:predicted ABC-type ATPase